MKKKYFILSCSLLFLVLIGSSQAIAQDNIMLGISEMITLAMSNNIQLKKANFQLENNRLESKKLEAENLLNSSAISDLQKKIALLNQQAQYQTEKDQLLIKIADDYFRIIMLEKEIESKKKNAELEKTILDGIEQQVAAGYRIDLDLLQQGNIYFDAFFAYQESELKYQQLLIEVKNRLGLNKERSITLTEMEIPELPELPLVELLEKARINSAPLKAHVLKIELAQRELKSAKADNLSEIEILKLENNFGIARLEKSMDEQDLDYQVESLWLNYNQAKNDMISSQRSLQQMKENEKIINRQVQAGLRSEEESLSASIGVVDAQYRFISSVRQGYQSYLELQRLVGTLNEGALK
ncbi:MAG: TolC family protein [Atribacterota bacterium]|nr:TolC family protein [Atribacterota bacterium]